MKQETKASTLAKYVLPAIFTNACIFLFNIVDGIFVGNGVGTDAVGAINLVAPFVEIQSAAAMLTGIGGVTVAAIRLGQRDIRGANRAFLNASYMILFFGILLTLLGTCATESVARFLGADELYLPLVKEYLFYYALFSIPCTFMVVLSGFCRNDGDPGIVGISTAVGTSFNVVLDWLFVFPLGLGLKGAALATGISQTFCLMIVLTHFIRKKGELRLRPVPVDLKEGRDILVCGLPEMIASFGTPITTLLMNRLLLASYGNTGVNSFSIIAYVSGLCVTILFGISEGLQPLFSYSYGAENRSDLDYYYRSGVRIALVGSIVCVILSSAFARPVAVLFDADSLTAASTVRNMPRYCWGFIFAGIYTLNSAYLYSTRHTKEAVILSVLHSFVLNTACILGLHAAFGAPVLWYCYGITELLLMIISVAIRQSSLRADEERHAFAH